MEQTEQPSTFGHLMNQTASSLKLVHHLDLVCHTDQQNTNKFCTIYEGADIS